MNPFGGSLTYVPRRDAALAAGSYTLAFPGTCQDYYLVPPLGGGCRSVADLVEPLISYRLHSGATKAKRTLQSLRDTLTLSVSAVVEYGYHETIATRCATLLQGLLTLMPGALIYLALSARLHSHRRPRGLAEIARPSRLKASALYRTRVSPASTNTDYRVPGLRVATIACLRLFCGRLARLDIREITQYVSWRMPKRRRDALARLSFRITRPASSSVATGRLRYACHIGYLVLYSEKSTKRKSQTKLRAISRSDFSENHQRCTGGRSVAQGSS